MTSLQRGTDFPPRLSRYAAAIVVALIAAAWTGACARRGFFPLDASVVYDGAWRIVCGQIPYSTGPDGFRAPYGLSAFAIGAFWMKLFGHGIAAWIALASTLAGAACFATHLALQQLTRSTVCATIGSVVTALWLQAPFGLPFLEQTAFAFCIFALSLIVLGRGAFVATAMAGLALVVAILAKQNAGLLGVTLACVTIVITLAEGGRRRAFAALATGIAIAVAIVATWLVTVSNPGEFVDATWTTPSGLLAERFAQPFTLVLQLAFGKGNLVARIALLAFAGVALFAATHRTERDLRLVWLLLALVLAQHAFNAVTNNRPENGYPYAGWIASIAFALMMRDRHPRWLAALSVLALVTLVAQGVRTGWTRRVHDALRVSTFERPLEVPGFEALQWGEPTRIAGLGIRSRDVEELVAWLVRDGRNFFVFPEFTALYGMLGREAPQPLVLFHPTSSFAVGDRVLGERVTSNLDAHGVDVVVFEDAAWISTTWILESLPPLAHWLEAFHEAERIGPFRILVRS
ncbi:MAG: hypothetical protein KDC95_04965 [Planctomycetes bacterium]|nr:hypothetical protein [Planctomycetota bacterium]